MSSLLAFDTATEHMSIALLAGGKTWLHEGLAGAQASTTLIPQIQRLLAEAGIALNAVDAIAFGRGPGAFTGLRTACSVAQGLAFGAAKPVLVIDTLMAVAQDARGLAAVDDVWVLMDARMGEIYAARYRWAATSLGPADEQSGEGGGSESAHTEQPGGAWETVSPPALYSVDAMNASFDREPPLAVAGTALDAFGDSLRTGSACRVASALPRATALMSIAMAAWRAGAAVDAALALPLYVRDKVALTTVERDAVKAAKLQATSAPAALDIVPDTAPSAS